MRILTFIKKLKKEKDTSLQVNLLKLADLQLVPAIFNLIDFNYSIIDVDGNYISQNNSTKHTISQDFLKAQEIDEVTWSDCQKVMQSQEKSIKEEFFRGRQYLSIKQPLIQNNMCIGIMVVSIDITERKLAEEREKQALIQAAEAKVKAEAETELRQAVMILTGSIVHDLKTPIASLSMKASTIQTYWPVLIDAYHKAKAAQLPIEGDDWELSSKMDLFEKISESFEATLKQMQNFINATLKTLGKAMRGKLAQEDLTLCSIWHCIVSTLNYYPFAEGEHTLVKWEQHYNFNFMGNEVLLVRVLLNLLNNALYQIRENKRGNITLSTEEGDKINHLRFRDTAGGAVPEVVNRLFEGYHTTKESGTGVGLAFCKLTMQSFGGDINCHGVQGNYIEFVLSFPKPAN